jgi:Putative glycolipid-binding
VGIPAEPPRVELFSDGEGNWTGSDGRTLSYLKGCEYVDISETPFTNSLPIRRLGLAPGESAEIGVAYLEGAELQPWPEPQRYIRLKMGDGGLTYRFVSLEGGLVRSCRWTRTGRSWTTPGCSGGSSPSPEDGAVESSAHQVR